MAAGGDLAAMAVQHGLDVKQLLASMPPGWKPGDPIPALGGADAAESAPAASPPVVEETAQQRGTSPPAEERAPAAPAPLLTGIFLDDFGQYDYVSSDGEGSSEDDSEESD